VFVHTTAAKGYSECSMLDFSLFRESARYLSVTVSGCRGNNVGLTYNEKSRQCVCWQIPSDVDKGGCAFMC